MAFGGAGVYAGCDITVLVHVAFQGGTEVEGQFGRYDDSLRSTRLRHLTCFVGRWQSTWHPNRVGGGTLRWSSNYMRFAKSPHPRRSTVG